MKPGIGNVAHLLSLFIRIGFVLTLVVSANRMSPFFGFPMLSASASLAHAQRNFLHSRLFRPPSS